MSRRWTVPAGVAVLVAASVSLGALIRSAGDTPVESTGQLGQDWSDEPLDGGDTGRSAAGEGQAGDGEAGSAAATSPSGSDGATYADVAYGDHPRQVLDLTVPEGSGPFPTIVWIHGGFWVEGDKVENPFAYHNEHGFAVASINYRYAGGGTIYDDLVDDVETAVDLIASGAVDSRVDPERIVVGGNSAGSHLATLTTFTRDVPVAGIMAFNGPAELVLSPRTIVGLEEGDFEIEVVSDQISVVLGCSPTVCEETAAEASPVLNIPADSPPVFIQHGTADNVVPYQQSLILADSLEAAGVPYELDLLDGVGHYVELTAAVDTFLAQFIAAT
jgi:acetyl esterase/lipase